MKQAQNAGALRTRCAFFSQTWTVNENNVETVSEENVFGAGVYVWCRWTDGLSNNMFTAEQFLDGTYKLKQPATILMRYSPLVDPRCIVYKKGDPSPYEILSVANVEDRNAWLEIKVQRKTQAR